MINREIVYERNLTGSYMKIPAGIHAGLDERLMLRRKIPGALPVEKAYVDGNGQYWYNISGKQSLDVYCRVKPPDCQYMQRNGNFGVESDPYQLSLPGSRTDFCYK